MSQDIGAAAADLAPVVDKNALAPIAVATGLRSQQMEQRFAVARFARGQTGLERLLVEERTQPLHRPHDPFIAFHPRNVVGPTSPYHLKALVLFLQLPDHFGEFLRAVPGVETSPNPRLKD